MANFNSSTQRDSEHLCLIDEMNFDGLSKMSSNRSKEMPPMNPLAVTPGLYIPPEETQQMQHNDDVMNWGMSDDQQDSDDDMDGNEFDLDFDDAEFLPPLNYAPIQTSNSNFSVGSHGSQSTSTPEMNNYAPYEPTYYAYPISSSSSSAYTSNSYASQPYPFNSRYTAQNQPASNDVGMSNSASNSFMNAYSGQAGGAPLEFINPSRLQLPQDDLGMSYTNFTPTQLENSTHTADMAVGDLNLDMEFEDLYPVFGRDVPEDQAVSTNSEDVNSEPFTTRHMTTPPAELSQSQPQHLQQTSDTFRLPSPPEPLSQTQTLESNLLSPASSPVENKTRRKVRTSKYATTGDVDSEYENNPQSRRKGRKSYSQPTASGVHVCDRVYPDGTQCNRSFTRPYDLARHHETLHAPVRKTYKCQVCGSNSKTFSRLDALSRHMRLKHPSE